MVAFSDFLREGCLFKDADGVLLGQRKLEAIREARRKEKEMKDQMRKEKFDDAKDRVRRKRKPRGGNAQDSPESEPKKSKKRVGFA